MTPVFTGHRSQRLAALLLTLTISGSALAATGIWNPSGGEASDDVGQGKTRDAPLPGPPASDKARADDDKAGKRKSPRLQRGRPAPASVPAAKDDSSGQSGAVRRRVRPREKPRRFADLLQGLCRARVSKPPRPPGPRRRSGPCPHPHLRAGPLRGRPPPRCLPRSCSGPGSEPGTGGWLQWPRERSRRPPPLTSGRGYTTRQQTAPHRSGCALPQSPDPDGWSENYRGWSDTCARRLGAVPKTQSQNGALTPKPRVSS